jgi:dephospho-CoA kinase
MSRFVVGLTGGIASGKSELGRQFEALGVTVVDADQAARNVVEPGPVLSQIAAHFGAGILLPDGQLDRRALRELVFADAELRTVLEAITHPAILLHLRQACEAAPGPYAIVAIPLLAEAGKAAYPWIDRILVVDVPRDLQLQRVMQRDGIDAGLAARMIDAQASREQRLALADDVVVNSAAPELLASEARRLDRIYRDAAALTLPSRP